MADLARAGLKIRPVVAKIFTDLGVAANINGLEESLEDADGPLINDNKPQEGKSYRPPLVTKSCQSRYNLNFIEKFSVLLLLDSFHVYHIYSTILPKMHFPKLQEQTHDLV